MNTNQKLICRKYWQNHIPTIIDHISNPLLGFVDLAVLGHLANTDCIAGFSIAIYLVSLFSLGAGVLRIMTINYIGEGIDREKEQHQATIFMQHIMLAIIMGAIVVALRNIIWKVGTHFVKADLKIIEYGADYFKMVIWGIPFVAINHVMIGWLWAKNRVNKIILIEVIGNGINLILDVILVKKLGIKGIAIATLCAQISMFLLDVGFILYHDRRIMKYFTNWSLWIPKEIGIKLGASREMLNRVGGISLVNIIMVTIGSRFGTIIMVVNIIILQIQALISYIFEAIAQAIKRLVDQASDEKELEQISELRGLTLQYVVYITMGIAISYEILGKQIITWVINIEAIEVALKNYNGWILMYPLLAGWGFSGYALYNRLEQKRFIQFTNIIAVIIFIVSSIILATHMGNHGLWFALGIFQLYRSICAFLCEAIVKEEKENV